MPENYVAKIVIDANQGISALAKFDRKSEQTFRGLDGRLRDAKGRFVSSGLDKQLGKLSSFSISPEAGIAAGAGLAAAIKTAGNYEEAIRDAGIATQATAEDQKALSDAARGIGKTTKLGAIDAALAIETLGRNSLSAKQILDGTLESVKNLSIATGGQMAEAADLATDLMGIFKIEASETRGVVDSLTGAAFASKFKFGDLAQAVGNAAQKFAGTGGSIDDLFVLVSAISPAFQSGAEAGTGLNAMLRAIQNPTEDAAELMQKLGIDLFNSAGDFVGASEAAEQLSKAFAGMTNEQKSLAAATLGLDEGSSAILALADKGAKGIAEVTEQMQKFTAAEIAAQREQGLNAALARVTNSFAELSIVIGETGVLDAATTAIAGVTSGILMLSELDPSIIKTLTGIGIAIAGIAAFGVVLPALGTAFSFLLSPIGLIAAAVAALVIAFDVDLVAAAKTVASFIKTAFEVVSDVITGIINGIRSGIEAVKNFIGASTGGSTDSAAVAQSATGQARLGASTGGTSRAARRGVVRSGSVSAQQQAASKSVSIDNTFNINAPNAQAAATAVKRKIDQTAEMTL